MQEYNLGIDIRVIPFVKLDSRTIGSISHLPKMLIRTADGKYHLSDIPLVSRETGIRWQLYYIYDALTPEEQDRLKDYVVTITIDGSMSSVVKIPDGKGKKRQKRRKKDIK